MAILTKPQRLAIGTFVLLLVDIIWVSSSELTKYIFKDENYKKPFFTTYIKTSMFMLYLLGFVIWKPWRDQCRNRRPTYSLVETASECEESVDTCSINGEPHLSDPMYIPIRFHDGGDRSSGNESDDSASSRSTNKSVRFSKLTEVRHLSDLQAEDALLARLSYTATLRAHEMAIRAANKLTIKQVAKIALMFSLLWFLGNLSYQEALMATEAGMVNVLSCSSGLFTLILASLFPSNHGDKFTLSKLLAVVISMGGVGVISAADQQRLHSHFPPGAVWSLLGALFYAAYIVLLRRKVDSEDRMDLPLFFGFVGIFNLLLIWPGFLVLHFSNIEPFHWPSAHQWLLILVNGLVGTVLSELLWLWGCFLTSSLIATLAISLTIPLTVFYDIVLKQVDYPHLFFVGSVPMLVAFFAVALLAHYENWDPALEGIRRLVTFCCWRRRRLRLQEVDREQSESLISGVNSEYT